MRKLLILFLLSGCSCIFKSKSSNFYPIVSQTENCHIVVSKVLCADYECKIIDDDGREYMISGVTDIRANDKVCCYGEDKYMCCFKE